MTGRNVAGKCDCSKLTAVISAASASTAIASTFIRVVALSSAFDATSRVSMINGGATISMPSATVVIHDRKKSRPMPPKASIVPPPAIAALAMLATITAKQKLATARGTMNERSSPSRRRTIQKASPASTELASVKIAAIRKGAPLSMFAATLATAAAPIAAGRARPGINSSNARK
jgi:hypothetical protein